MSITPIIASANPMYCATDVLFHSPKKIRPTEIELTVNKESITPDAIVSPYFVVTKPKVINTSGEIKIRANRYGESLSSLFAHKVLIEFAETAIATVIKIYNTDWNNLIVKLYQKTIFEKFNRTQNLINKVF